MGQRQGFSVSDADRSCLCQQKINSVLSFSDVVLDQPLVLSKDVPKGYSAVALSDILKMITTANLL